MLYRLVATILILTASCHAYAETVKVCQSSTSPYLWLNSEGKRVGSWAKILEQAEPLSGLDFEIEYHPRKRCEALTTVGNPSRFDITVGRVYSDARASKYWTIPVFQQYGVIFYSRNRHPDGLQNLESGAMAERIADLDGYRMCGFHGWEYEYYRKFLNNPDSWEPLRVRPDDSGGIFANALRMVDAERCDAVEFPLPAIMDLADDAEILEKFSCFSLKKERSDIIYLMVSKNAARSEELATKMFQAFATMHERRTITPLIDEMLEEIDLSWLPQHMTQCVESSLIPLVR